MLLLHIRKLKERVSQDNRPDIILLGFIIVAGFFFCKISGTTSLKISSVLFGLGLTLLLGLLNGFLLEVFVTVPYPPSLKHHDFEKGGGGIFLGLLERILFFASFWQSTFLAAGWLAFKLGAKWSVWEQIIKVPGSPYPAVKSEYRDREQLGSRLLGRFLNGTMWNLVCGLAGAALTRMLWAHWELNTPDDVVPKILDALRAMVQLLGSGFLFLTIFRSP